MTEPLHLPENFELVYLERVDSTNEKAKRRAQEGAAHGTVIWARAQSAGKGRRGRTWISEPGNLYCSIVLKPDCSLAQAAQVSFVIANSIALAVDEILETEAKIQCKWPNDVLINGKKTAGVLLETVLSKNNNLEALIAGIGINIMHHPSGTEFPASHLYEHGVQLIAVEALLEKVCKYVAREYETWRSRGFGAVRLKWLEKAYGIGQEIEVRMASNSLTGTFVSLDEDGALLLDVKGKKRLIHAGDVIFDQSRDEEAV